MLLHVINEKKKRKKKLHVWYVISQFCVYYLFISTYCRNFSPIKKHKLIRLALSRRPTSTEAQQSLLTQPSLIFFFPLLPYRAEKIKDYSLIGTYLNSLVLIHRYQQTLIRVYFSCITP